MSTYYLGGTITVNSIFHFLFPALLGHLLGKRWLYGIGILIVFELFENLSGYTFSIGSWSIFSPEPTIYIVSDLIIGTFGLYVGMRFRKR